MTTPADLRARLLDAMDMAGQIHLILDDVGPMAPEPERGALLQLRGDVAHLVRALGNIAAFLGTTGAGGRTG